jgi:hypothetical protein
MNPRIKEFRFLAANHANEQKPLGTTKWQEIRDEKFAELIVAECAELVDNKVTITAAQTYDEVFVAKYDTKELCAKQIREHFGVEE